eukprot:comp19988_c0_seq1/m.24424 comp19988_c0_seq1/g.24424  ORF comp19988_c0_seq1/g.24424 comp19988_c0_seq1/m.24424 type:complete len:406 (-) comp19988_c0_seq1:428-1645(-)
MAKNSDPFPDLSDFISTLESHRVAGGNSGADCPDSPINSPKRAKTFAGLSRKPSKLGQSNGTGSSLYKAAPLSSVCAEEQTLPPTITRTNSLKHTFSTSMAKMASLPGTEYARKNTGNGFSRKNTGADSTAGTDGYDSNSLDSDPTEKTGYYGKNACGQPSGLSHAAGEILLTHSHLHTRASEHTWEMGKVQTHDVIVMGVPAQLTADLVVQYVGRVMAAKREDVLDPQGLVVMQRYTKPLVLTRENDQSTQAVEVVVWHVPNPLDTDQWGRVAARSNAQHLLLCFEAGDIPSLRRAVAQWQQAGTHLSRCSVMLVGLVPVGGEVPESTQEWVRLVDAAMTVTKAWDYVEGEFNTPAEPFTAALFGQRNKQQLAKKTSRDMGNGLKRVLSELKRDLTEQLLMKRS